MTFCVANQPFGEPNPRQKVLEGLSGQRKTPVGVAGVCSLLVAGEEEESGCVARVRLRLLEVSQLVEGDDTVIESIG